MRRPLVVIAVAFLICVDQGALAKNSCLGLSADEYLDVNGVSQLGRWQEQGAFTADQDSAVDDAWQEDAIVVAFDTNEGTFMNVDVSPSGKSIVFDLLGDLYILPIEGGVATPLTSGIAWDRAPVYSSDGSAVFFVSDRNGRANLWRVDLASRNVDQISDLATHIVGTPNLAPDGRLLVGVEHGDNGLDVVLNYFSLADGKAEPVEAPKTPYLDFTTFSRLRERQMRYSGVADSDGAIFFEEASFDGGSGRSFVRLNQYEPAAGESKVLTAEDAAFSEFRPQLSHDGRWLSFFRQHPDRATELWVRNLSDSAEHKIANLGKADDATINAFQDTRPNYAFSPDDKFLVFSHNGRLVRKAIRGGEITDIPFKVRVERKVAPRAKLVNADVDVMTIRPDAVRWPNVSADFSELTYAAMGYLWRDNACNGQVERLTDVGELVYMPSMSPDGDKVAYISFEELDGVFGSGKLRILDLQTGRTTDLLADPETTFLFPKWSADGQRIALIRERQRDGRLKASVGWTSLADPFYREAADAPGSNDYLAVRVFSRFVGFDEAGERLLFSYRTSQSEARLFAVDLNTGEQTTLTVAGEGVWGIVPSPDLAHLGLVRSDETVWVVPFPAKGDSVKISIDEQTNRSVSPEGGYYLDWASGDDLVFSFGQSIYRYSVARDALYRLQPGASVEGQRNLSPIAFRGGRIITMARGDAALQAIEPGTIVIDNGRIAAVGYESEIPIPAEATVIDVAGDTIIPGLIDSHYHRIGGGGGVIGISGIKLPNANFGDESALGYGVTAAWEPGGPANDGAPWVSDLQTSGRIPGPRWTHSASGGVGTPWEKLNSYEAALAAVRRHAALGVQVLKEYNTPTREQQRWLSKAAWEENLGIVAHIQTYQGMMTRVVDGYTGGEHPYIPAPFYKDVAELMRQTGFVWTPNIEIVSGSLSSVIRQAYFWNEVQERDKGAGKKLQSLATGYRFQTVRLGSEEPDTDYALHRISRVAAQAAAAARYGVNVGVSAHSMPGAKMHGEMWHLHKGGMPIEKVLFSATMVNAEKLGLQEQVGSLEVGKIADFLILEHNPLDDILNTLSIEYTVQGGVIYDADTAERKDPNEL